MSTVSQSTITIAELENKIRAVEGFPVRLISNTSGRKVPSHRRVDPYRFQKGGRGQWTTHELISRRITNQYGDITAEVYWPDGNTAKRNVKVKTLRAAHS